MSQGRAVSRKTAPTMRSVFSNPENSHQMSQAISQSGQLYNVHQFGAHMPTQRQQRSNAEQRQFQGQLQARQKSFTPMQSQFGGNHIPGSNELHQPNSQMLPSSKQFRSNNVQQQQQFQPQQRFHTMSLQDSINFVEQQAARQGLRPARDHFSAGQSNYYGAGSLTHAGSGMARNGQLPPEVLQMAVPFQSTRQQGSPQQARIQKQRQQQFQQQQQQQQPQNLEQRRMQFREQERQRQQQQQMQQQRTQNRYGGKPKQADWFQSQQSVMVNQMIQEQQLQQSQQSRQQAEQRKMAEVMNMGVPFQPRASLAAAKQSEPAQLPEKAQPNSAAKRPTAIRLPPKVVRGTRPVVVDVSAAQDMWDQPSSATQSTPQTQKYAEEHENDKPSPLFVEQHEQIARERQIIEQKTGASLQDAQPIQFPVSQEKRAQQQKQWQEQSQEDQAHDAEPMAQPMADRMAAEPIANEEKD